MGAYYKGHLSEYGTFIIKSLTLTGIVTLIGIGGALPRGFNLGGHLLEEGRDQIIMVHYPTKSFTY